MIASATASSSVMRSGLTTAPRRTSCSLMLSCSPSPGTPGKEGRRSGLQGEAELKEQRRQVRQMHCQYRCWQSCKLGVSAENGALPCVQERLEDYCCCCCPRGEVDAESGGVEVRENGGWMGEERLVEAKKGSFEVGCY